MVTAAAPTVEGKHYRHNGTRRVHALWRPYGKSMSLIQMLCAIAGNGGDFEPTDSDVTCGTCLRILSRKGA